MSRSIIFSILLGCCVHAAAETVAPGSSRWQFRGAETQAVEHLGRKAIRIGETGAASLPDISFDTGVIEFDLAVSPERSFPGIAFRIQDLGNYEHFYVRPHRSGNPDANQYTPVFNRATGWQIYYGTDYSAPIRYRVNEWMHLRIEVAADSARVYIDSDDPSLLIHDLKRDRAPGFLALLNTGAAAYFSNFSYAAGEPASIASVPAPELPTGLVRSWTVSEALSEADAQAAVHGDRLDTLKWSRLDVESNGIANLGRTAAWAPESPTALGRVVVRSDRARSVRMRFGFSDRVRLYLNGTLLYEGDDSNASRDYRFLGTVGLYDAVHLPLRQGHNEIVLAVSEVFGGWAAMAAFDEMEGLTLAPN